MQTLEQHALSAAFPRMNDADFQKLKDSIEINGVLNPITLLDGMVLDGWHRYSAATELDLDCPTVELGDGVDPVDFVRAQNAARRHLTPSQIAFALTALYSWRPAHREKKVEVTTTLSKSNAELASMADVCPKTIQQAKAVHADAVPAIQALVKAGSVSVEIAATVAKLPAAEQVALAAAGPDAMRAAAKPKTRAALRNGTDAKATVQAMQTQAKADAAQVAADAYGDSDPIAMLEASEAENAELRSLLAAAEADDQKAETLKWRRIADVANRRQNELMDTVNAREKELQRHANWLRRIGNALGEEDHSKLAAQVEALARTAKAEP